MSDEIAISVNHVSKSFRLPHEKKSSIKSIFTSLGKGGRSTYEVQHALHDITFDVKKGEFFGIVGRNGSGKSTLLKILAEIYQPTDGTVSVKGRLVPFIELGVGFNPELTGRENVYLSGALSGFSTAEMDEMYDDIVDFAELEPFMDQKLKNYSSGMQVRLAFSVATRAKADILLIDEVLAVGDADFQRKCFDYFDQLKHNQTTVVFVSHDMEAVKRFCNRVVLIDHQELVEIGDPIRIAEAYAHLFINQAPTVTHETTDNSIREGNGLVTISNPRVAHSPHSVSISYSVSSEKSEGVAVTLGLRVRSLSGVDLLGANNHHLNYKIQPIDKKHHQVEWSFPNILGDGTYLLDLTVHNKDLTEVYDWWEEAVKFKIKRPRRTPYNIEPDFKLEVE